jgi:hypothetical protein
MCKVERTEPDTVCLMNAEQCELRSWQGSRSCKRMNFRQSSQARTPRYCENAMLERRCDA